MRLSLTIAVLFVTGLSSPAQLVKPPPVTVMFANSGSFVVKVNRELWLRGLAGAATPGWKQSFVQADTKAGVVTKQAEDRWVFSGTLGPEAARDPAWVSYNQTLSVIGETFQVNWRFRMARDMELDLLYVSLALPAKRFAGKPIRFDTHDLVLPERPVPAMHRPITGRPQRIVIDSGSLGAIAVRFDKAQVVWVEDLRASGGDGFELRVLLATGELKAGDTFGLALQVELAERPELVVGGTGREFQNNTKQWTRFDLRDTAKPMPATESQKRAPTDASALLHTPAGKFGVLQAKSGRFTWPNGVRQKFWGIRLAPASAPAKEDAENVAARIAESGVNLVCWTLGSSPSDDAELDRFDRFIAELARRGIYSQFTLPTPRSANPAVSTPLVVERLAGFVERAANTWLLRQNRYTGKRYSDEPSLALLQISSNNPMFLRPSPGAPAVSDLAPTFYRRLYSHLRKVGAKCPIITDDSIPAAADLSMLITAGDAIGISGSWDPQRPDGFIENKPLVSSDGGYLGQFASAALAHKPLLVTRIAHQPWNEYRAEAPLLVAAHAALQDWDGVIWDNYTNDPATIGQFPVAARIFLGGLVSPSRLSTHVFRDDPANVTNAQVPAWLTFISRWRNALPNVTVPPPDIIIASSGNDTPKNAPLKPPIRLVQKTDDSSSTIQRRWVDAACKLRAPLGWEEGAQRAFASDNGQLTWDQDHGLFTVLAPACCAAVGFIGGKSMTFTDVTFDVGTPRFAAVSLIALDGHPIASSHRLLLTTLARCENTDQQWFESLDGSLKVLSSKPGTQLEPVSATITLRQPRAFKLFVLTAAGQRGAELMTNRSKDNLSFVVHGESMSYELVIEGGLRLWPFGK